MENIAPYIKDWFEKYRPEGTEIEQAFWIFWAVWILLILIAVFRVIKFRVCLGLEDKKWDTSHGLQKPAVVIVPIKGATPSHTSDFFQSLLEQDYWKYRIIVSVETSDDPAAEWLCDQFGISLSNPVWAPENRKEGLQSIELVVAGKCKGRGQKVHNQLAAFEHLRPEDEILAFVDADIVCPPDWLSRLAAPVNQGTHDPATTYRWLVPRQRKVASQFASVINASVTTQGGNVRDNMPWGGSMALSRQAYEDLRVPELFAGSLNDDLRLGKAAKRAGYRVGYIRNLVRPTEIDFSWSRFFEFARRQYLQVKVFAPILYFAGNLILAIYFWGFVSIVVAITMGYLWAWVPLIIATILDQIRAMTRESIYRRLFGSTPEVYRRISATIYIEHMLTPIYMSLHGLIVMSTWFMNKVEWGGVKYQVQGVNKTRVLHRQDLEERFMSGAIGDLALPAGAVFGSLAMVPEPSTSLAPAMSDEDSVTFDDAESISVAESEEDHTFEPYSEVGDTVTLDGADSIEVDADSTGAVDEAESGPSGSEAWGIPVGATEFVVSDEDWGEAIVDGPATELGPWLLEVAPGACEYVCLELLGEAEDAVGVEAAPSSSINEETATIPEGACEFTVGDELPVEEAFEEPGEVSLPDAVEQSSSGADSPISEASMCPVSAANPVRNGERFFRRDGFVYGDRAEGFRNGARKRSSRRSAVVRTVNPRYLSHYRRSRLSRKELVRLRHRSG